MAYIGVYSGEAGAATVAPAVALGGGESILNAVPTFVKNKLYSSVKSEVTPTPYSILSIFARYRVDLIPVQPIRVLFPNISNSMYGAIYLFTAGLAN
jgi:hypothetical protein